MSTETRFAGQNPTAAYHSATKEELELHKEEIADLWLQKKFKLTRLMRHFRNRYHFEATEKQWKAMFSKWELRRNMVPKDAAHIWKLYQDAEAQALSREVFFNGDLKTRVDIAAYIRRYAIEDSETEFLKLVEGGPLPRPVTYIDTPQPQPSGMYMHHTISRDLSGTNDQVMSKLLAALGERSSRTTDLSVLADRSTHRADLSVLISKSEESTRTTQRLPFRQ